MSGVWTPLIPFAFFFLWWFFLVLMGRGKFCPDCGAALPIFQSPFTKSWRQWVEGGYRCANCGCETTLAGRKIAAGTPPASRSVIISLGLLTLSTLPGILLLILLLRR
jgi:hypothetical protein